MRYKQAVDISFSYVYFEMINPANVVKIFADRASNLLFSTFSNTSIATSTITSRECELAELLCGVLESIINSHLHTFEVEITLETITLHLPLSPDSAPIHVARKTR